MPESKEFSNHAADIRVKLSAETLPRLLELILESLNEILSGKEHSTDKTLEITEHIDIASDNTAALLIDFISEALTLSQVHKAIFPALKIDEMSDTNLSGILYGTQDDTVREDIRAIAYHDDELETNEEGNWETKIIFEI